jgi:methyl-accepting chemotaxis protein
VKKIDPKRLLEMQNKGNEIKSAISEINEIIEKAKSEVGTIFNDLKESSQRIHEMLDDDAREAQEYHDDRSEKWQESETGKAYEEWISTLETLKESFDPDNLESIDFPVVEEFEALEELSEAEFSEFQSPEG